MFFDLMLDMQAAMLGQARRGGRSTALSTRGAARTEEVIPLAEEVLNVEARKVAGNTTRVRRYVVETPAERRVTLRDERVVVERRRPIAVNDAGDTLTEKTVEATDTSEVPVVWKGVRVKEEVVLRLEATERTETVRDTLRRDEVEIQQPKAKASVPAPREAKAG
jgi:stress response protein YsnF